MNAPVAKRSSWWRCGSRSYGWSLLACLPLIGLALAIGAVQSSAQTAGEWEVIATTDVDGFDVTVDGEVRLPKHWIGIPGFEDGPRVAAFRFEVCEAPCLLFTVISEERPVLTDVRLAHNGVETSGVRVE